MAKSAAPDRPVEDLAGMAMADVLRAEREAGQSVELAQREAVAVAERSRAQARSIAERTERRIRAVVRAFEQELSARLAEIEAEAALAAQPHALTAAERSAVAQAVRALAARLTGAPS